jgi:hypothetical protein
LLKKPNPDDRDKAFITLVHKAKVVDRNSYKIIIWEDINWEKEEASPIIEGFISFCSCYRFVRIEGEKNLLVNAFGNANTTDVSECLKIVTDVRY